MTTADPCYHLPLAWWRLPFAMAVALHGRVIKRCQLCDFPLNQSESSISQMSNQRVAGSHTHWFNRLSFICQDCHDNTAWLATTFTLCPTEPLGLTSHVIEGVASVPYQFPYDAIMRRYKNSQQLEALLPLLHVIRQLPLPTGCHKNNSVIVPVPTTLQRLQQRGFAPLWWLTLYLSFHWQIPIFTGLERHERQHQQGLNREQRLDNLKEAFYFTQLPRAKHLILFDDVVTTGATLQAIIDALFQLSRHTPATSIPQIHAYCLLHGS